MTCKLYEFLVSVEIEAPFLIAGLRSDTFGLDICQIRDTAKRPIIPDTHFKGVMRHAWSYAAADDFDMLFGPGPDADDAAGTNVDGDRSRLSFGDLTLSEDLPKQRRHMRVPRDDQYGTAKDGGLVFLEMLAPPGKPLIFEGTGRVWLDAGARFEDFLHECERVARHVGAIGRFKTVGFGRTIKLRFKQAPPAQRLAHTIAPGRFDYEFELDKRLLVDVKWPDPNTLKGEREIPGAVLKGTLAAQLDLQGQFTDETEDLLDARFSHAKPVQGGVFLNPQNALRNRMDASYDPVLKTHYFWPPMSALHPTKPVKLRGDWKTEDFPKAPTGDVNRELRLRVSINESAGAAATGALFTEDTVLPDAQNAPIRWRATLDFDPPQGSTETTAWRTIEDNLAKGLFSIGKTRAATKTVTVTPSRRPTVKKNEIYTVVLMTPALMLREFHLEDETSYAVALNEFWEKATNGALRIATEHEARKVGHKDATGLFSSKKDLEFFCHQEFRGRHDMTQKAFFGADCVEPFVLSKPGSVFKLFPVNEGAAQKELESLMADGLPTAVWFDKYALSFDPAPHFTECPYLPSNGYGEIWVEDPV